MRLNLLFKAAAMLLFAAILVITGCREDDDPPAADTYNLLVSQMIGPDGGTVGTSDMTFEFPAGSVTTAANVELYSSSTANPFGEEGVSDVFWLKGLPDFVQKPVKITMRYRGSLSDLSYVAAGRYMIATSGQDTVMSQALLVAEDSSGYLVAYLPAGQVNPLKSTQYQGRYGIPFWSISSYWYYQTDHFLIHFPGRFKAKGMVENLADGLEGAYDKLYEMGFRYNARTSWPVEVTVKLLDEEIFGQSNRSFPWTANSGYIEINTLIMPDKPLTKITGAHEFFHIVQDLYNSDEKYNWLQEASSVWFEEEFDVNPDLYVSGARQGHELVPFNGLQAGAAGSATHHGYGCSAVIKYLVGQYGEGIMKEIWEDCRDNSAHPLDAIKGATDPFVIWWSNFMREYTLGNVYGDMSVSQAVFNEKFTISSDQTTHKTFTRSFPDISGYVYVIELTNPSFKETDKLQLTLTGEGRAMYVLKKTGSEVTSLGFHVDQLNIPDLKGLKESNSILYILVTNYQSTPPNYTGTSTITLDALVTGGASSNYINYYESPFKTAAIGLDGTIPRFLIDVKSAFTSPLPDFRVSIDSIAPWDQSRWMELKYLLPPGNFSKSIQVSITMKDLIKNPATSWNWENPYISQLHLYVSDKNGQKDYYYNYTETITFNMEYDQLNQSNPFCQLRAEIKDPADPYNWCSAVFYGLAIYWER